VLGLAILACAGLHLRFYLASPSGRFPVLDGAENMALAQQIAAGTLPAEPFFRAMLYPGLLSLFLLAGVGMDMLPAVAGIVGCGLHLGSTVFVYWIARRAWASARAGLLSAALFGLNPVALYFATEPLDTTLGLFLFLAGLNVLHKQFATLRLSWSRPGSPQPRFWAGIAVGTALWVLAILARPHYAITLACLPLLLVGFLWRSPRRLGTALAAFGIVAVIGLGATGIVQKRVGGEFRIMPTQGAYSLWVGNRPGANGRYYEQQIHLTAGSAAEAENPARVESEILYRRETAETGPLNMARMNSYWRARTRAAIQAKPLEWAGLMGRKIYFLFNDFEQYNNKTFAVQKTLSPVLRIDPLGWGITFILCASGLVVGCLLRRRSRGLVFLAAVAAAYGVGVVLFFVSDRFRLPLTPFLCVGAGIWGCISRDWLRKGGQKIAGLGAAVLAAGLLTFSRGWGVHDLSPAVQDYVLLSIAARKAGEDMDSLRWARRALEARPDHPDGLACAVTSFYNLKLQGVSPGFPDETWDWQSQRAARIPEPANSVRLIQAVALWKTAHPAEAQSILHALTRTPARQGSPDIADDALGILLLTNLAGPTDEARARSRANETTSFYLLVALHRRETASEQFIPASRRETVTQTETFVRNIFP
jgi:hypothetical protein